MASIRYLCAADVDGLDLDPATGRAAIIDAFRAYGERRAVSKPKLTLPVGEGRAFQSMCASWPERGLATTKWLGTAPVPPGSGLPTVHAMMVLNDYETGQVRAVMDGNVLTSFRTAAMSAAAAQFLARPDSRCIGFIGCGVQARAHLVALRSVLPGLTEVRAFSRTQRSAELLVSAATGLEGYVETSPEAVLRASDVVVTSVPLEPGFAPFLAPEAVRPGAFVASVDIARPWKPGLRGLDLVAIDDHAQRDDFPPLEDDAAGRFDADLAELANGRIARRDTGQRTMFISRGVALADLAIAAQVLAQAERSGVGLVLPR